MEDFDQDYLGEFDQLNDIEFERDEERDYDEDYGDELPDVTGDPFAEENIFGPESPEFKEEIGAFERAGGGKLAELLSVANRPDSKRQAYTPEDRILIGIDAFAREVKDRGLLTEQDINYLLDKTQQIPGLRYKNPSAYVLGYIGSGGGAKMNKENISRAFNLLSSLRIDGVVEPDVVRYARFWTSLGGI